MTWDGIERRKKQMPPDDFTPSGAFEGYVYAKLEGMEKRLDSLDCGKHVKRIGDCENAISNIKGKAAILGTLAGVVSAWFVKTFLEK